jgi:hypothetical protein
MSSGRARLALWLAAVLLVPLPYLVLPVEGAEPVVRFLFLGAIAAAYSACVDGSGVAWILTGLLLGNALVHSAGLGVAAWLLARAIPASLRRACVLAFALGGAAVALAFPIYRTPFDDVSAWSRWLGLFQ